jgi:MFS family permease
MHKGRAPPITGAVKWWNLGLIALGQLLAMTLWFSASAVVPQLTDEWNLSGWGRSLMTMSVQIGFVAGAVTSAVLTLSDRIQPRHLCAICAALGAWCTALLAFAADGVEIAVVLRFLTGAMLAGVYPPGMKLIVTWCKADRGLGIGILIGALTLGSATPHLLNAAPLFGEGGMPPWRPVLYATSGLALLSAIIMAAIVRAGPLHPHAAPFDIRAAGRVLKSRPTRLANFGYFGHMWELYAMWTAAPAFLIACYSRGGWSAEAARIAGFAVIGIGAAGCVLAGIFADRIGRTVVASASMIVSGACALVAGFLIDQAAVATIVCLVWGFAVVADSAQFSAAISELTDPMYIGTALTLQTSIGFLLTLFTIRLTDYAASAWGWNVAFALLAIGPAFGVASMLRLRTLPEATKMAGGRR